MASLTGRPTEYRLRKCSLELARRCPQLLLVSISAPPRFTTPILNAYAFSHQRASRYQRGLKQLHFISRFTLSPPMPELMLHD